MTKMMVLIFTSLVQSGALPDFTGASVENYPAIIRVDDYPQAAMQRGEQGYSRLAVSISSTGKPTKCVVSVSSGSKLLDDTGCRLYLARAKFRPATINGVAVPALFMTYTAFLMPEPGTRPKPVPSFDVAVGVNKLPVGQTSLTVTIDRVLSADGAVSACRVAKTSGSSAYDALACLNAGKTPIEHILDDTAEPVEGVISQTIIFVTDPTSMARKP